MFAIISFIPLPSQACTPDCQGKQCGDDGCGGSCGTCQAPAQCVVDQCVKGCGEILDSCCYKHYSIVCDSDEEKNKYYWGIKDCGTNDACRWDEAPDWYRCDPTLPDYEDPSGVKPRACDFNCVPDCKGKDCGHDGCGGPCGECGPGGECKSDGRCCYPDCNGKDCGSDGCGGQCGFCHMVENCKNGHCVHYYGCKTTITPGCPDCACEQCVCEKDPACCFSSWDYQCMKECRDECGGCKRCVPDCTGKECGPDGCGGFCGYCKEGDTCKDGRCVKCVPDCTGKECGDDGCGGSCGQCQGTDVCDRGHCRPCNKECLEGMNCGSAECGSGPCQSEYNYNPYTPYCQNGDVCRDNYCVPCDPYCKDRECGSDGCDGSCGECGPCEQCISHHCKPIPDCEAPDQGPEPVADMAEDVRPIEDAKGPEDIKPDVPAKDPGVVDTKTHKDTQAKDTKKTDLNSNKDKTAPADTAQSDVNHPKSGSGGCTTTGNANAPYWILLLLTGLLYLRKRT